MLTYDECLKTYRYQLILVYSDGVSRPWGLFEKHRKARKFGEAVCDPAMITPSIRAVSYRVKRLSKTEFAYHNPHIVVHLNQFGR